MNLRHRFRLHIFHFLAISFIALMLIFILPLAGGGIDIANILVFSGSSDNLDSFIFWNNRVPRVCTSLLVGGCLSLSGLVFQAVLKNPLSEPYILGVSAGAALGKIIFQLLVIPMISFSIGSVFFQQASSLIFTTLGALFPVIFILVFLLRKRNLSPAGILLAGLMINTLLISIIMMIQYLADLTSVKQMQLWWLGSFDVLGFDKFQFALILVVPLWIIVIFFSHDLNILSLDDDSARQLGLNTISATRLHLVLGTLLASVSVAIAGPIAFVGLVVPHCLRAIFGADNRILCLFALPYGALFLSLSDFIGLNFYKVAQLFCSSFPEQTIPVGIVTSFIGAPLFLFLLIKRDYCT